MRKLLRNTLAGLSFTSALFIFQACYGSPQDDVIDFRIEGQVRSKTDSIPIFGIKVTLEETGQYMYTDTLGRFSMYTSQLPQIQVTFEDIDSLQNGAFKTQDTILTQITHRVNLDILMEEK